MTTLGHTDEASSFRRPWTHFVVTESGECWHFDLNIVPPPDIRASVIQNHAQGEREQRQINVDLNDDVVSNDELERVSTNSMARVEQSQRYGPTEVVGLDSFDELEDNGYWDTYDIFQNLASDSRTTQGIDSESLQLDDNHLQRNVRRRVESPEPRVDINVHSEETGSSMAPTTLECPICMRPLVEQMATKCGHMFCKGCIRSAIDVQAKCPVCRRKAAHSELRRIYFS